jgi:predicted nucleic acid-binding Zn ribbon protein
MRCIVCGLECVPYTRRRYCSMQCQRRAAYVRRQERQLERELIALLIALNPPLSRSPSPGGPPPQDTRAAA